MQSLELFSPGPKWKSLVSPDWMDFVLGHFSGTLSVERTLGRVVSITDETPDVRTFTLRPNAHWRGFLPGQFVAVRAVIDAIVHERCYSLISLPRDRNISFTVKRVPGGLVSNWLHDHLALGDVLELGNPAGTFVQPVPCPEKLLFIAGGVGITPIYAIIGSVLENDPDTDIRLLYYARAETDFVFYSDLLRLMRGHPNFRPDFIPTRAPGRAQPSGGFSAGQLHALVPDFSQREAFLCGPSGLMGSVARVWEEENARGALHTEVFALPKSAAPVSAETVPVTFRRSCQTVEVAGKTLLETAEAAGLKPASGCRMGVCRTCVCTKVSGTVRDRATGALDAAAGNRIRICVSEPVGPVELDL